MSRHAAATGVVALPLAAWERDGLKTALAKAELPHSDLETSGRFFWRFEREDTPAGFGGMELHGDHAVLRSIVTLAPLRRHGIGTAILAMLETEAAIAGCRTAWVAAHSAAGFFQALDYKEVDPALLPEAVRTTPEFATVVSAGAVAMSKPLA